MRRDQTAFSRTSRDFYALDTWVLSQRENLLHESFLLFFSPLSYLFTSKCNQTASGHHEIKG
jgi:hypothetical protein